MQVLCEEILFDFDSTAVYGMNRSIMGIRDKHAPKRNEMGTRITMLEWARQSNSRKKMTRKRTRTTKLVRRMIQRLEARMQIEKRVYGRKSTSINPTSIDDDASIPLALHLASCVR